MGVEQTIRSELRTIEAIKRARSVSPRLPIAIDVQKRKLEHGIVIGWAYPTKLKDGTVIVDSHGHAIRDEDLELPVYEYVANNGIGDVMHDYGHQMVCIESCIVTDEKRKLWAEGDEPLPMKTGWWLGYRIIDEKTLTEARLGHYPMFSIAVSALEVAA